jgi:colanic acid/amylovoran biosynthesis glycosyltransferase
MRRIRMATIVILTDSFPFPGGEQFLETEIEFWGSSSDRVILLPAIARDVPRSVPAGIEVDLTLARTRTKFKKAAYFLATPFSKIFLNEVAYLRSVGKLNWGLLYQAARSTAQTLLAARGLCKTSSSCGGIDLVYTYWNDTESFGAALSKRRGYVKHVVSRAHRFDVYEEIRAGGYMPVKRQFIDDFDAVYPISQQGHDYMAKVYGVAHERNIVSRLGVRVPDQMAQASESARCHIVSVSYCTHVKRIDKIIHALAAAAQSMPEISFKWTHVGGGPLLPELQKLGDVVLSGLSNLDHVFMGTMAHDEVLRFLVEEPIDMFINTSESEGIAVSIMESMSCGIPAIAPDVGGLSELVGHGRGVLMSTVPEVGEIAGHLSEFVDTAKKLETRQLVREIIDEKFNAVSNYGAFVVQCAQMARTMDVIAGSGSSPVSTTPETLGD